MSAQRSPPRVHLADVRQSNVVLGAAASHHLVRVRRLRRGDPVEVFDGEGRVWSAVLGDASAQACALNIGPLLSETAPPKVRVELAVALIKGDAMDRMLRAATELGVDDIRPLLSGRSQLGRERADGRREHWRRILVSAAEQCRRAHLPQLHPALGFDDFLDQTDPADCLLLRPGAPALPMRLPHRSSTLLVGPEGGWTGAEVQRTEQLGIRAFSLGNLILRAETAPLAALAALRHAWAWR
ncbi:MAG: 16S rRNA (uracil(1498)-N(3))-methyltransferase [Gammaproteobacteria bacterium]|nr:16S rRNA (uracil(1498)-N(3))-methyltransferase [Gammaproteobacteria bacterium]